MLCAYVGYVQWAMFTHPLKPWVILTDLHTDTRYKTKMSARNHYVSVAEAQYHVIDPTNPGGAFDDGVEARLYVRGRAADDAEHLRCCRLMFQGLPQFGIALLQFFEQPHVFDGDGRLVSKSFKQRYLSIGERSDLYTAESNDSDSNTFPQ